MIYCNELFIYGTTSSIGPKQEHKKEVTLKYKLQCLRLLLVLPSDFFEFSKIKN